MVAGPGEISAATTQRADPWALQCKRNRHPLWVWLAVALLAIGTAAYVPTVYFVEFIAALF